MNQLALTFDPVRLARKRDPQTSHDAAQRASTFAATHAAKIYAAICEGKGLTYRDIARIANLEPVAVARRLSAMEEKGLIRREGEREGMGQWWKA